jgi:hypothetical protein
LKSVLTVLFAFALLFAPIRSARAVSVGDSVLTVGISTLAGGVLGLSTLPFYKEPSENTRMIFYGAALGAVAGVLIVAYAGFQDSADSAYEEAKLRKYDQYDLASSAKAMEWKRANEPAAFTSSVVVYSNLYGARF